MEVAFFSFLFASIVLRVLNVKFERQVRARHVSLLAELQLDEQGALVSGARWYFSLLPYSKFILRKRFATEFREDPELLKLSEVIFWVHVVQVLGFGGFILSAIAGNLYWLAARS